MAQVVQIGKQKNQGGRPRKFNEPSRPVTLTLPFRTLELLESIDSDRALAITKATDWVTCSKRDSQPPVQIVEVEKGRAIILVGPSRSLRKIKWLKLVEIAPSRFLLVIPTGTPIESLEVAIMDLIEGLDDKDEYERELLGELRRYISQQRRSDRVSKAELLLIDISD